MPYSARFSSWPKPKAPVAPPPVPVEAPNNTGGMGGIAGTPVVPGTPTPGEILSQLQGSRQSGMQEGLDFLVKQGLGTVDASGKFTPTQFLGSLTPAAERAAMASREAGLTDIGATQGRAARQLRGIQGQSGVTGPAAGAQQMALLSQGQQARAQMERQLQEKQIGIEEADLQRRAQERLLGLSVPMQFGALGAGEGMGAQQLGLGYQGMGMAKDFLKGLMPQNQPAPWTPQSGRPPTQEELDRHTESFF